MFSPWPDLQAYQTGAKLNPPSDIGLFVSVAVHNLQDGRSISNQDWDTLLKEACPLLKLKSKSKASKPYFKLAESCLKRANQKLWSTTNSWQVQRQPEFWNWSSSSLPLHNQTQERTRLPQLPHHNLHQSLLILVRQALMRPVWLTSFLRMWWQILLWTSCRC